MMDKEDGRMTDDERRRGTGQMGFFVLYSR
jgi:hypothetical protein